MNYNQDDFKRRFQKRLEEVREKTDLVFKYQKVGPPPFIVNSAFYHLFGIDTKEIPDHIFDDPAIMTQYQEALYCEQIKAIPDDFVPYLVPWFGTVVLSSALGSKVVYPEKADPAFDARYFPIQTVQDVKRLDRADPDKDGLMPKVLDFMRYMKNNSFLPVGITDCQGPYATANQLVGYDRLVYMMIDNPSVVHELFDKITESAIIWIKRQKGEIGEALNECFGDQQIYIGENAGIWLSDDDAVLVGPDMYREFVVPYNARIFEEFGGGILHYCGNANHQIDNFLRTKGLVGINVYCLHNLNALAELKRRIENRLVLIACDFTPGDYQTYYKELSDNLSYNGLIINSQFSTITSLTENGAYVNEKRDKQTERKQVFNYIHSILS